jgi:transposase
VDAEGEAIARERIASSSVALERTFGGLPAMLIVIESGGHANWVARRLRAMGHEVIVADAKRLKLLWDTKSKDDNRDTFFMARIGARCPEFLCAVEPSSLESEQNRAMLRLRDAAVLELDGDVERLSNSRAAGAMVGLRPMRRESGESKPELGITKEGNQMLRRYLVQCAQYMLGHHGVDCALRRWGLKLAGTSKRGKKRAVAATARKLAVLLHTLWRKDVDFDPGIGLERAA